VISVDDAWARVAERARPLQVERRDLAAADGRVLAESVVAPISLPPFDRAAMDGYAVRAADVTHAGARLQRVGERGAGAGAGPRVGPGEAVGISTGAMVPEGADAVVMAEVTRRDDDVIVVTEAVAQGANIRYLGEDISSGTQLLAAGTRLAARHLGLLAGSGITHAAVHRTPRVGVAVTGNELVPAGEQLAPGMIYESNGVILRSLAARVGAEVRDFGTVGDDLTAISTTIAAGLELDLLLITGGVSVGKHDQVNAALAEHDLEIVFRKVAMRPGKPIVCARHDRGWVLALPGNPLACVVGFLVFAAPLLRLLDGEPTSALARRRARLSSAAYPALARTSYVSAQLRTAGDGVLETEPLAARGSAMTKGLADANGFIVLGPGRSEIRAGSMVNILEM
jgi:molybdopterin molybdotransferase